MQNDSRIFRQPVAVDFLTQSFYSEEPLRQIENEILYIEKGKGSLFLGNTVSDVQ